MRNSTSENDPRKELARRNVRLALVHVALAIAFVTLFIFMQLQR